MGYPGEPLTSFKPPQMPSQLDPKDERLLELSAEVGRFQGENDLLAEDNGRLEDDNRQLRDRNKELSDRNVQLERQEVAYNTEGESAQKLISAVEQELKDRKK